MRNSNQCQKYNYGTHKKCSHFEGRLINGINYERGNYRDGINDEDENCVKFRCTEITIVRVSLPERRAWEI